TPQGDGNRMQQGTVVRMFHSRSTADQFGDLLRQLGFSDDAWSVIGPDELPRYGQGEHAAHRGGVMERLTSFWRGDTAPRDFVDWLTGLGVAHDDAKQYEEDIRAGSTMVIVRAGDRANLVDALPAAALEDQQAGAGPAIESADVVVIE